MSERIGHVQISALGGGIRHIAEPRIEVSATCIIGIDALAIRENALVVHFIVLVIAAHGGHAVRARKLPGGVARLALQVDGNRDADACDLTHLFRWKIEESSQTRNVCILASNGRVVDAGEGC